MGTRFECIMVAVSAGALSTWIGHDKVVVAAVARSVAAGVVILAVAVELAAEAAIVEWTSDRGSDALVHMRRWPLFLEYSTGRLFANRRLLRSVSLCQCGLRWRVGSSGVWSSE